MDKPNSSPPPLCHACYDKLHVLIEDWNTLSDVLCLCDDDRAAGYVLAVANALDACRDQEHEHDA